MTTKSSSWQEQSAKRARQVRQIVRDAQELAEAGVLRDCNCAKMGRKMPCQHVLEVECDVALLFFLDAEDAGLDPLKAASERLASFEDYEPSLNPMRPTNARPGSDEKIRVLTERIRRHESVWREGDAGRSLWSKIEDNL